ncbi:MAG: hypothetical protein ACR2NE_05640 [Pirellulales bacterium]
MQANSTACLWYEDGNETMLGRVVEAYNVKTRQQFTPTNPA